MKMTNTTETWNLMFAYVMLIKYKTLKDLLQEKMCRYL